MNMNSLMKAYLKYLVLCLYLLVVVPCAAIEEGKAAPEFHAKLFNGEKFSLAAVSGQVVIIHFWATWCEPCRVEMPLLEDLYKRHHAEGLQIVAVSMDSPKDEAKARELMKSFSFSGSIARDASFKSYGRIWKVPMTFLIDRKGILQKDAWKLKHDMMAADLENTVNPLLKSKP